jgi:ankyrin repeat protein
MKTFAAILLCLTFTIAATANAGEPSLATAVTKGDLTTVKHMLADGGNPNAFIFVQDPENPRRKNPMSLLALAAQAGNVDICALLIGQGAAVNLHLDNTTALHAAVRAGRLDAARVLLNAGASPSVANADGNGALLVAAQNADIAMVRILLEAGADPDNARILLKGPGQREEVTITPLIAALEARRLDIAELLLDSGADINFPVLNPGSSWLYNALGFAIYRGNLEQATFLIDRGAIIDLPAMQSYSVVKTHDTQIPLAQALASGDPNLVKLLIERGANLYVKTPSGMTIPHILAPLSGPEANLVKALRWLAEQGVPIDSKNVQGVTPLARASMANRLEVAKTLIDLGADPEFALPHATRYPEMTRLLLNARKR